MRFIRYNVLSVLLLLFCCSAIKAQSDNKPNVLLLTVSDMSWDAQNSSDGLMPNMKQLAEEGILFNQAFVNVADGQPSYQIMLTGRYPHNNGSWACDGISDTITTLPKLLKDNNYFCALLGNSNYLAPKEVYAWDKVVADKQFGVGREPSLYGQQFGAAIKEAKLQGKPFFAMVNIVDAQRPFAKNTAGQKVEVPLFLPDLPDIRTEISQYNSSLMRADLSVGAVIKALNEAGVKENTVIVFLASNGMAFPFAKSNCYPQSNRTPLIVCWKDIKQTKKIDDDNLLATVDLMPTILDIANISTSIPLDGQSFKRVLQNASSSNREYVYLLYNGTYSKRSYPMRALYSKKFAYVVNFWSDQNGKYKNNTQEGLTWRAMIAQSAENDTIKKRIAYYMHRSEEEFFLLDEDPYALNNRFSSYSDLRKIYDTKELLLEEMKKNNDPLKIEYEKRYVEKRRLPER